MPSPAQAYRLRHYFGFTVQDINDQVRRRNATPFTVADRYNELMRQQEINKQNKAWQTRNARNAKRRKIRPSQEINYLDSMNDVPEPVPNKPERMIQVNFRIFREDTNAVKRNINERIGGRERIAHEYIEDYDRRHDDYTYYLGEDRILTAAMPFKFINEFPKTKREIKNGDGAVARMRNCISTGDLPRFLEFIHSEENDEFYDNVQNVFAHYGVILAIESYENAANNSRRFTDLPAPTHIRLLELDTRMSNRYLNYEINPEAVELHQLFKQDKYYMADACMANAIMNMIADKYNAKYKLKPRVTYELMWKLTHIEAFNEKAPFPLSFEEAQPIFEYFGMEAEQRHTSGRLEASYKPKSLNKHIPNKLIYIRKDHHAFPVTDDAAKKSLVNTVQGDIVTQGALVVSDRYPLPNIKSILVGGVTSTNELVTLIMAHVPIDDVEKFIKVLWCSPTDLSELLQHMMTECRFHPTASINNRLQVESLTFKVGKWLHVSLSRPPFGSETIVTKEMNTLSVDAAMRYQELKQKGLITMCNPLLTSTYSESLAEMLRAFNRAPV